MTGTRPTRKQLTSLLPAAQRVLEIHVRDQTGMCHGCRELWARLVPYPCTQARWATSVTDRIPSPETLAVLGIPPQAIGWA
jgi:hypothetical protein